MYEIWLLLVDHAHVTQLCCVSYTSSVHLCKTSPAIGFLSAICRRHPLPSDRSLWVIHWYRPPFCFESHVTLPYYYLSYIYISCHTHYTIFPPFDNFYVLLFILVLVIYNKNNYFIVMKLRTDPYIYAHWGIVWVSSIDNVLCTKL